MKKYFCLTIILLIVIIFVPFLNGCSNKEKQLINDLSNSFNVADSKFSKNIKNAVKQYPQNKEIRAIYCYYNSKYYQIEDNQYDETINYKVQSQLYLRQINSTYNGAMAKEIYDYGISLFGTIEEWNKQTNYYNSKYNKLTKNNKKQIIKWIKNRFNYYDDKHAYRVEDKYSQVVFTEAANNFNFLYEEINMLWFEYVAHPYPLNLNN